MPCNQRRVCPFAAGEFDEEGGPSSSFDWSSCACLEDDKGIKWDLMRSIEEGANRTGPSPRSVYESTYNN